MKIRQEKGITLVALIITIIVLLILAMVSISLVMNGGIIDKSKAAVDKYSEEEIGEQLKLAYSEYQMSQYTGTPIDIQAKLQEIYGANTTATLANGKLKATINGKIYQYDVNSGKSGEYIDPINYGEKTKATIEPGDDIIIGRTEKFKVFSVTNSEIKAMPYYNLKLDSNPMRQATEAEADSAGEVEFSTVNYWNEGDIEINVEDSRNNIQQYIAAYKTFLEGLGTEGTTVRVGKKSDLDSTEITDIMRNPEQSGYFWLCSGVGDDSIGVYFVNPPGNLNPTPYFTNFVGVRPIIIIQK